MATTIAAAPTSISSRFRLIEFTQVLLLLAYWAPGASLAQTEIYKCTDADGGIVYSQLPCAPENPVSDDATEQQAPPRSTEPTVFAYEERAEDDQEQEQKSAEEVAACKKQYRDAIDVIDAEIGRDYSAEQADAYKQRLLELTRQLRKC